MRYRAILAVLPIAAALPAKAGAESTVCSNPARERILARATIEIAQQDPAYLERQLVAIAPTLAMSSWSVGVSDNEKAPISRKTLGLQSRLVSVSITAQWKRGSRIVPLLVERTCFDDSLEPWQGYWAGFLKALRARGYQVRHIR